MNKTPFFTIAIPVIKIDFFEETLKSAINQTFNDYEIIVVNNASTIDVKHEIKKVVISKTSLFPIKYFENEIQLPAVENWNKCVELSSGNYFILLSDDDLISKNILEEFSIFITKYPDVEIFHTRLAIIDEKKKLLKISSSCPEYEKAVDFIWHRINGYREQFLSDFLVKRDSLIRNGGFVDFPDVWGTDDATWFSISIKNGIVFINKILFYYRTSLNNISRTSSIENKLKAIQLYNKWLLNLISNNFDKDEIIVKDIKKNMRYRFIRYKGIALNLTIYDSKSLFFAIISWFKYKKKYSVSMLSLFWAIANFVKRKYIS